MNLFSENKLSGIIDTTYLIIFWELNYAVVISDPWNDNTDKYYTVMPQYKFRRVVRALNQG